MLQQLTQQLGATAERSVESDALQKKEHSSIMEICSFLFFDLWRKFSEGEFPWTDNRLVSGIWIRSRLIREPGIWTIAPRWNFSG